MKGVKRMIITNRKIDELGRLVLPLDVRTNLNLNAGDSLEICLEGKKNVLIPNQNRCAICKSIENLSGINDCYICRDCKEKICNMN